MIEVSPCAPQERPDRPAEHKHRPILHVLPTFAVGGVQVRTANIINHFGDRYRHAIVALDGDYACKSRLCGGSVVDFPSIGTHRNGLLGKLIGIRAALRRLRPRMLLTYNWGTTDWALANTLSPVCRHIHLEDGFGVEEADRQFARRVLFRRIALARTSRVVVPSQTLVDIATRVWKLSPDRVLHIPNGVDCSEFAGPRQPAPHIGFRKSPDELVVGTIAPLRPEKNLELLLRAFAAVAERFTARLLIAGEGPERPKLSALAKELRIEDKVVFTGHVAAVQEVLGVLDVFAMTSKTEQMPFSVLQAMAAARPIAAVDVGDVKRMLAPDNRAFVVPKKNEHEFRSVLERLLADPVARFDLGLQNQAHVRANYPQERMFVAYESLFGESNAHQTQS